MRRIPVMAIVLMAAAPVVAAAQQGTSQQPASQQPAAQQAVPQQATPFKTDKEKLSYAMGMDLAGQLKASGVEVDPAVFARGMQDLLAGGRTLLTDEQAKSVITELQKTMFTKRLAEAKVIGDRNRSDGEKFLAANKAKEGVVTLPSGLQYKVLTTGNGPKPTLGQSVTCNYRGTLIDGREFDSSYKRGQPATFPVKGVIKGWTEVLQLMPVGSKWQVFVPPDLAYGDRGAGSDIGPNATLIFEIELLGVK